jgi:hypothetical protein
MKRKQTTYVPNDLLGWIQRLTSDEFKVFLNLCSWAGKSRTGWVTTATLARGRFDQNLKSQDPTTREWGCNMTIRGVQRIMKRFKVAGAKNVVSWVEAGKRGIRFQLLPVPLVAETPPLSYLRVTSDDSMSPVEGLPVPSSGLSVPSVGTGCPLFPEPLSPPEFKKGSYTKVSHAVVRGTLNGNALKVYVRLKANSDKPRTKGKLGILCCLDKRQIQRAIDDLVAEGLVAKNVDGLWSPQEFIPKEQRADDSELYRKQAQLRLSQYRSSQRQNGKAFLSDEDRRFIQKWLPGVSVDDTPESDPLSELLDTIENEMKDGGTKKAVKS